ncbi:MAG: protein jag [Lachnospiraceae bacterium]|nr:protein jag [Lachnospiraceae bacterium]
MADKKVFTADTIDDAITKATMDLGIPSDRLGYEILDRGAAGFLGIGRRRASISAWEMTEEEAEKVKEEAEKAIAAAKAQKEKAAEEARAKAKADAEAKAGKAAEAAKEAKPVKKEEKPAEKKETSEKTKTTANDKAHFEDGKAFLLDVFDKMGMEVEITYDYDAEENSLNINLAGKEMGVLIGKRGQTLDSLQYLTSLVVNRSGEHYIRVKLDTENYRERRKETLEALAKNIAYKVKRTRKSVSLEPMNPYERRIIHSALQQDNFVMTKSEGEEPFRHVVVFYRRNKNGQER